MFRSETMSYYSMVFSRDNSWEVLDRLGVLGIINFDDLHKDALENLKLNFSQISHIKANLVKLSEIEKIIIEWELLSSSYKEDNELTESSLIYLRKKLTEKTYLQYFHDLYGNIEKDHKFLMENRNGYELIEKKVERCNEYINILDFLKKQLPQSFSQKEAETSRKNRKKVSFDYMIGVVKNEDLFKFQRTAFRISRGNVYTSYIPVKKIENSFFNKQNINKTIVFLTFQSSSTEFMINKINKLCDSLSINLYPIPDNYTDLNIQYTKAILDNKEANQVLEKIHYEMEENLKEFSSFLKNTEIPRLYYLKTALLKEMLYYKTMNKLSPYQKMIEGRFWIPEKDEETFKSAVITLTQKKEFHGLHIEPLNFSNIEPPTHFRTNQFSYPFQNIIDTYGVPRYKEANPGLFAIAWFPYMFGTMFGDAGHGLALTIISLFIVFNKKSFDFAIVEVRSLLLFLGCFSFYCGMIYNDFLSISLPFHKSCYDLKNGAYERTEGCVYPFGIDYSLHLSLNSITIINSFKMKLSIVIGVLHMVIGITLKGLNALYFSRKAEFFFEFLPQLIFFLSTFGYMVVCIILKWFCNFTGNTANAPSIISLYINFVQKVDYPLYANEHVQLKVQRILALIAVICVPIMFFVKPILISMSHKKTTTKKLLDNPEEESQSLLSESNLTEMLQSEDSKEEHSFGEDLVHQAIETIEFVLGSISNTASYLRLWALSLAHAQLAEVFLNMLIRPYFMGDGNPYIFAFLLVIMYIAFFFVSVGVLMIMSLMECLLHALRLQWVEFQNKFYKGDGYKFEGFEFKMYIRENFDFYSSY